MAFKMKGYSAYDKMEPSGYKKMGSAYDKHGMYKKMDSAYDKYGAYKQTDGEKKQIQIEKKPNPDSELEVNDANLQKLATKYKIDNVDIIKNLIKRLDDNAGGGDGDFSLPDVEDAVKNMIANRGDENVDEED